MVEFGLKLQDNKFVEWEGKYIDYEGLKKLILKGKKATKFREDLEKRNPDIANEVKVSYMENVDFKISSEASLNFTNDASSLGDEGSRHSFVSDERSVLLPKNELKIQSVERLQESAHYESTGSLKRSNSDSSLHSFFSLGVAGYFQRQGFAQKFKDALKAEDASQENFSNAMEKEVIKVNEFYDTQLREVEERLKFLVGSANFGTDDHSQGHKHDSNFNFFKKSFTSSLRKVSLDSNSFEIEEGEDESYADDDEENEKDEVKMKEADSLKRDLEGLHRRTNLLLNFGIMNSTGFIKIVKKFNKTFPGRKGRYKDFLKRSICSDGKNAAELADRMENYYAKWFCQGSLIEARAKMLPKKGDGLDMDWSQLRLGYRLGMCFVLAVWITWDCIWGAVVDGNSTIGGRTAFPVFRGCGGLVLLQWFWGASVYVWNRYRINYIFLFDFDPRLVSLPLEIFEDATDKTLVYLILMLLYYKSGAHDIPDILPPGVYAFILVLYAIKCLVFPLRTRLPMWKAIFHVVTAPITAPTFFHTYIADVFTSMVKVFQDICWTACFIISGDFLISERDIEDEEPHQWQKRIWYKNILIPLICLFPLWIRFNQCLRRYMDTGQRNPNLLNAFKYALSQTVTLFGAFHPLYLLYNTKSNVEDLVASKTVPMNLFQLFWTGLFVGSSLYSFFWDVYFDWGLGRPEFGFLGSRLMFPKNEHYYGVMFVDLFLRFMWVTTLVPPMSGAKFEIPNYLTAVTMSLELFRRTVWGFFRLEHAHRDNSDGFRKVDFVPLHFSTGHNHNQKQKKHIGWNVLGEVFIVTTVVLVISAGSVIAAQKATKGLSLPHHDVGL